MGYPIEAADLSCPDLFTFSNETTYSPDGAALLAAPLPFEDFAEWQKLYGGTEEPYILILHTHGTESYAEEGQAVYTSEESFRTTDIGGNVVAVGAVMGFFSFFHGELLAGLFAKDAPVIAAAAEYLKAYAIDCLLTAFLFCYIGYFNGTGATIFVMLQGIIGAFGVRLPVSWLVSRQAWATLFYIGLATPASTLVQITLCGIYFIYTIRKQRRISAL